MFKHRSTNWTGKYRSRGDLNRPKRFDWPVKIDPLKYTTSRHGVLSVPVRSFLTTHLCTKEALMSRIRCRLLALIWISCVVPNLEVSAQSPAGTVVSFPVGTRTGEKWNDNPLKIEFLWCEPGKFTMGSPKNEKDRGENEDQVEVTLTKGFWLGKYEVTQEQWRSVMNTEPWLDHRRVRIAPDSPACWVSWEVANLFCRELTHRSQCRSTARRMGLCVADRGSMGVRLSRWHDHKIFLRRRR